MMIPRWAVALVLALCATLAARHVEAAATPAERARASALFAEGRRLMQEKKYEEACQKLEESHRLDPGGGTVLNLAVCHETIGKTASAWAEFSEGYEFARRDRNDKRMRFAQEGIKKLEPRLSTLTIVVPEAVRVAGMVVRRNGESIDDALWGFPAPVDPGEQLVEISAPEKKPWSTKILIEGEGKKESVTVPLLEDAPPPPEPEPQVAPAPPPAPTPAPPPPKQPPPEPSMVGPAMGWVLTGLGVAGVGVGTVFGIRAITLKNDSDELCPDEQCTAEGVEANDDAGMSADVSTATLIIGGSALVAGVVLLLTTGGSSSEGADEAGEPGPSVSAAPAFGPSQAGLVLIGAW